MLRFHEVQQTKIEIIYFNILNCNVEVLEISHRKARIILNALGNILMKQNDAIRGNAVSVRKTLQQFKIFKNTCALYLCVYVIKSGLLHLTIFLTLMLGYR